MNTKINFNKLLGKIFSNIEINHRKDELTFHTKDGEVFELKHQQDCCESVSIENIVGNFQDLIN